MPGSAAGMGRHAAGISRLALGQPSCSYLRDFAPRRRAARDVSKLSQGRLPADGGSGRGEVLTGVLCQPRGARRRRPDGMRDSQLARGDTGG